MFVSKTEDHYINDDGKLVLRSITSKNEATAVKTVADIVRMTKNDRFF